MNFGNGLLIMSVICFIFGIIILAAETKPVAYNRFRYRAAYLYDGRRVKSKIQVMGFGSEVFTTHEETDVVGGQKRVFDRNHQIRVATENTDDSLVEITGLTIVSYELLNEWKE